MAGNTRFHNKYHFAQHHSEVTDKNSKYPEATTDPLASQDFPFQGVFYSDGVLKIHSQNPDDFNYFHNNTTIGGDLTVEKDTLLKGDLEVIGNVLLRADPKLGERVIQIGNDLEGGEFDVVKFRAYVDSHFSPDYNNQHDLGEPGHFWRRIYTDNLTLSGELMVGDCTSTPFRGMYINNKKHQPDGARLGINTCDPQQELHVVGDGLISEDLLVLQDIEGQSDLHIHNNADIDGVITLLNDNQIRWENDITKIHGNGTGITFDVDDKLIFNADNIDMSNQAVNVQLIESTRALCIDDGTLGIDAKNNRVGINTCDPISAFHVEGNILNNSNTSLFNTIGLFKIDSANEIDIFSQDNIEVNSRNNMQVSVLNKLQIQCEPLHITTSLADLDIQKIDISTQPVNIDLANGEVKALNIENCMLNFDTLNTRVGIHTCEPQADLHIVGDIKMTGGEFDNDYVNYKITATNNVDIESGNRTLIKGGNVGLNVDDPKFRLSIPCGDSIGTFHPHGNTDVSNRILFCEGIDNTEGWDDMVVLTDGKSDVKFKPGRSVQVPDKNVAIGAPYNNSHPQSSLEVRGTTHVLGDLVVESYEANGQGQDRLTINSYINEDVGTMSTRSGVISGGNYNNILIDIDSSPDQSDFDIQPGLGVRYNNLTGSKQLGLMYSSYMHDSSLHGYLGVNTNEHVFTDAVSRDGDGNQLTTNMRVKGQVVMDDSLWVDQDVHVNNDQVIDGMLTINSGGVDGNEEATGLRINKGNIHLVGDNTGAHNAIIDTKQFKYNKSGADDLGSGSNYTSTFSSGLDDHLTLDLRNTSDDQRFAVRYSSLNDGIADKIGLSMTHYSGVAHVGVGIVPTVGNHLHVNGNTLITGNITIDGDNSQLQTSNLVIEDPHILLNRNLQGSDSTNATLLSAGIWFAGDDNEVVGYVRVHDTDLSKLVAKAPTGQVLEIDINGGNASILQMDSSTFDIETTTITTNDSTVTIDKSTVDIDADLTVEDVSLIDQDLTKDSTTAEFAGLKVESTLEIPHPSEGKQTGPIGGLKDGLIRYNTQLKMYQGSKNQWWVPLDQVLSDLTGKTNVAVTDSDAVVFTINNQEILRVDEDGLLINTGDRSLNPALKYVQPWQVGDIVTMDAAMSLRGLGAKPSPEPAVASQAEMIAAGIVVGNKYIVVDHRADSTDVIVQLFTSSGMMIVPDEIHIVNNQRICIDLTSYGDISGKILMTL